MITTATAEEMARMSAAGTAEEAEPVVTVIKFRRAKKKANHDPK